MNRLIYFSMRSVLLLGSVIFMIQSLGQEKIFRDLRTDLGQQYVSPGKDYDPGASRGACQYILDDGTIENSIGLTAGGDIMWLNYFTATAGCELINTIYASWGEMSNGGSCRVFIYEDPDDDGNPDDAVYLTEAVTTVQNAWPDYIPGYVLTFTTVSITPTLVSGGFFVAALCQNHIAGQYPLPLDEDSPQGFSWVAIPSGGPFDVIILSNNEVYELASIGFPGNAMLRVGAEEQLNVVPLSDWAIYLAVIFLVLFSVYRFRRI